MELGFQFHFIDLSQRLIESPTRENLPGDFAAFRYFVGLLPSALLILGVSFPQDHLSFPYQCGLRLPIHLSNVVDLPIGQVKGRANSIGGCD